MIWVECKTSGGNYSLVCSEVEINIRPGAELARQMRRYKNTTGATDKILSARSGISQPSISRLINHPPKTVQIKTWESLAFVWDFMSTGEC